MGMKQTIEVLNQMAADGIVESYAIGGAIAAFNYIEPTSTDDLDILVSFDTPAKSGLVMLTPIFSWLAQRGYADFHKEGIVIEGWPVQFLPVSNPLDAEALAGAVAVDIEINPVEGSVSTRVLSAEHVMATALNIGRPKDHIRIHQFLESDAFDQNAMCVIIERHGLAEKWAAFCKRFGLSNKCASGNDP